MWDVHTPIDVMTTVKECNRPSSPSTDTSLTKPSEPLVDTCPQQQQQQQQLTNKQSATMARLAPLPSPFGMEIPPNQLLHLDTTGTRMAFQNSARKEQHDSSSQTFIVYLMRHGEASHNVKEKAAKQLALEQAIAEGLAPDSDETRRRMETARAEVLYDERLFDAPLSQQGREEAKVTSNKLRELIREHQLPPPREVLVSPLTRTLETANLVFPENNNIHVREELRERCTGKPPDTRSPSDLLRSRESFKRFSMDRLQFLSQMQFDFGQVRLDGYEDAIHPSSKRSCSISSEYSGTEEDKEMLRVRTKKLIDLLAESQERSIAVVTHKGYLRELERGQFGKPLAGEFQNCEIRVYRVIIDTSTYRNLLEHTERLV
jgi:broad specificity phosphatase PhoE